ncbi:MAG: hypothetical protein KZQ70_11710 [gamma proteobacterium symbiont of Lucinoma myriamae]|nr:hypothetical protein [gamma proteobacterium symbiont of Lucinoma myriamae]
MFTCCHAAHAESQNHSIATSQEQSTQAIKVDISITGIDGELKNNALAYLELNKHLNDPHFSEAWLQKLHKKAKKNIMEALQPFGYYQVSISSSLTKESDKLWQAEYAVNPGDPVKIADIDIVINGPEKKILRFCL